MNACQTMCIQNLRGFSIVAGAVSRLHVWIRQDKVCGRLPEMSLVNSLVISASLPIFSPCAGDSCQCLGLYMAYSQRELAVVAFLP